MSNRGERERDGEGGLREIGMGGGGERERDHQGFSVHTCGPHTFLARFLQFLVNRHIVVTSLNSGCKLQTYKQKESEREREREREREKR